jgi:acyl carrier protein
MAFPTLDAVLTQLREIAEDDTISADSKLASLDVDSLDVLEWIFEIEGEADIEIDDSLYDKSALETSTVGDFYESIKAAAGT